MVNYNEQPAEEIDYNNTKYLWSLLSNDIFRDLNDLEDTNETNYLEKLAYNGRSTKADDSPSSVTNLTSLEELAVNFKKLNLK